MRKVPHQRVNHDRALAFYFIFKLAPTAVAGMSIYLGYKLFILGVSGQASLSVRSDSVSGQLLNAAPGLFFAIGGIVALLVIVWRGVNIQYDDNGAPNYSQPRM